MLASKTLQTNVSIFFALSMNGLISLSWLKHVYSLMIHSHQSVRAEDITHQAVFQPGDFGMQNVWPSWAISKMKVTTLPLRHGSSKSSNEPSCSHPECTYPLRTHWEQIYLSSSLMDQESGSSACFGNRTTRATNLVHPLAWSYTDVSWTEVPWWSCARGLSGGSIHHWKESIMEL